VQPWKPRLARSRPVAVDLAPLRANNEGGTIKEKKGLATAWRSTFRLIDANLNRAREAARVAEEYARFVLDSAEHSRRLKDVRHKLRGLAAVLDAGSGRLLAARDTPGDVGTDIGTPSEAARGSTAEVAAASLKRLEEALRVIEEYAKTERPEAAAAAEALRYETYAIESGLLGPRGRLRDARLYVIVTAGLCRGRDVADVARAAVRGGAEIIQLREKEMEGREFLAAARRLRAATGELGALFIVNDRVDVAAAAGADGVHLGQTDLPPTEARKLLGPGAIIGVSTHSIEEARRAVADGADYIGVGTIFATQTKVPKRLAGLEYVRAVASETRIPGYPIGGMNADTIPSVLEAGGDRAAVCTAIIAADDIEAAARRIRNLLPEREGTGQE